jgi:PAS domain S-box-containing protein
VAYAVATLMVGLAATVFPPWAQAILPWNPQPALIMAPLLVFGLGALRVLGPASLVAWAALAALGLADPPHLALLPVEFAGYGLAAAVLRNGLKIDLDLPVFDQLFRLIAVCAVAALIMAGVFCGLAVGLGGNGEPPLKVWLLTHWLSDMIGLMVIVPGWLVHRRLLKQWRSLCGLLSWQVLGQAMTTLGALFLIFPRVVGSRFYPIFIPLVWIAARHGLAGVVAALLPIQLGFAGAIIGLSLLPNQIVKLQILMLSLSLTGLLLGAVITERERARASVIRGEARLKAIIDMAPDGMLITDEAGIIEMSNQQAESLSGLPAAQLIGQRLDALVQTASLPGQAAQETLRTATKSMPVEVSRAAIDIGGRASWVVLLRDISERKRAEAQLERRRSALETASRSTLTEELAAALAHELNQPLSAVITYAGACQRTLASAAEVPPKALEQLAKAVAQAERAGNVIRHLREFFRHSTVDTAPVGLAELVRGVLPLFGDEALRLGVQFAVSLDEALKVMVDRVQIEQVVVNLIRNSLNALEAQPGCHGLISIEGALEGDNMVRLTVADNGPGISADLAEQLFVPFTTTRCDGMGLGLSISRSIVLAHGGQLWADLETPQGARMHATLPLCPQEATLDV